MSAPKGNRTRQGTGSKASAQKDDRLLSQGLEFHKAGDVGQAAGIYADILSRNPKHPGALHLLGVLFYQSGSGARGAHLISQAVELEPDNPVFLMNLGNALQCDGQLTRAEESFRRALAVRPDFAEAFNNLGTTLAGQFRLNEAIDCFGRAISINPSNPEPYNNRGNAYQALKHFDPAHLDFQEALRLRPDYADAHSNLGYALVELNRLDEAVASFESATRIDRDFEYVRGALHHTKMRICDWSNYVAEVDSLLQDLTQRGAKCVPAFAILSISDSLSVQRRAAEIWASDKHPSQDVSCPIRDRHPDDRVRIGYYSADFYQHATAYLIAEIFELHDKTRFEVIAFHFGPLTGDQMQRRIEASVDSFQDVSHQSDYDIAQLSRALGIDIAIDLKGFTQNQRAGIFANRAAPVQINFLGYPGTMGAGYIDYIIADSELIPEESRSYYTEDIIYLPGSYQPNDRQRVISSDTPTRSQLGLPEQGFVYCCFNNNFKINPDVFDAWIEILNSVPGSVLWLLEDNPGATRNLRREAQSRGLAIDRIFFAQRAPLADHLARHRLADLFLDTWPYNAHTTASDALWAGLPVLTWRGESFAARVGASLLRAVDLPELIMENRENYVKKAIELGQNPTLVTALNERLRSGRMTASLFDSVSFTRKLEAAYLELTEE